MNALTLATLAAQPRFASMKQSEAIDSAISLLQECRAVLGGMPDELRQFRFGSGREIPEPKQWPAKLLDFYRLIVRSTKDEAEDQSRFKRFLRSASREPDNEFVAYKRDGFDQGLWRAIAYDYRQWWENELSAAKARAGRAGAEKRKEKSAAKKKRRPS